ncbi:hypothetical protein Vadar_010106 [Vaccinium darrowii]|uniref:Uncharacterized protein n=1 Tax=Vaccinium darrowii TaxID=229202 RepID=A0ACB7X8T4_9ERIC|nr:hypothetical protein Vadar_010106 [Vaccinium darrowii]
MLSSVSYSPLVPTLLLLLSLPLLFLFAPRILPPRNIPISLPDELDDLSLFRKAAAADSSTSSSHHRHPPLPSSKSRLGSTNPSPKIAFLFLTNSDLHFSRLWAKFFANASSANLYNIYVHADPTVKITIQPPFTPNQFIPAKRTQRSSPTLIAAARRLLATAILDDRRNLFFALISQHCIPLHSFTFLHKTLFHRSISDLGKLGNNYYLHYRSFIEISANESFLLKRYNARGENVMLPEVPFDRFKIGSQFFILTRRHALVVVKDRRLWRKFKLPCIWAESCYPEEHYFPTLLSMEDPEGCTQFTLTRVNWTGMVGGHPHTYQPPEVSPELIYKLRDHFPGLGRSGSDEQS